MQSGLKRPVAELKLKPLGRSLIETLRTHIRALLKPSEPTSRSPIETFEISRTQTCGSMCSKNSPSPRVSFATQLEPNSRTGALEAALAQPEKRWLPRTSPVSRLEGLKPGAAGPCLQHPTFGGGPGEVVSECCESPARRKRPPKSRASKSFPKVQ